MFTLPSWSGKRDIIVIGDLMVDKYYAGRVSRISPEAPVPIVHVHDTRRVLGGAGNVIANLLALGANVSVAGIVGLDEEGKWLKEELLGLGAEAAGLFDDPSRPTAVKTRVMSGRHQMIRLDWEETNNIPESLEEDIYRILEGKVPSIQAVLLSDYKKGCLTSSLTKKIIDLCLHAGVPVFADTKVRDPRYFSGATILTPNLSELEEMYGKEIRSESQFIEAGKEVRERYNLEYLLVTRGERGMSLFPKTGDPWTIGTAAKEVYDVTGAGDTVLAALAIGVMTGLNVKEAMLLATLAARVVISKVGTAQVTFDEISESLKDYHVKEFIHHAMYG